MPRSCFSEVANVNALAGLVAGLRRVIVLGGHAHVLVLQLKQLQLLARSVLQYHGIGSEIEKIPLKFLNLDFGILMTMKVNFEDYTLQKRSIEKRKLMNYKSFNFFRLC